jgi:hypothetical protein
MDGTSPRLMLISFVLLVLLIILEPLNEEDADMRG